jgi:serine/threonine protein kinase
MGTNGDPFDLSDAIIKEEDHVRVSRRASKGGKPCTYWKSFQPGHSQQGGHASGGLAHADYWTDRENRLIAELWAKNIKQVVQLAEVKRTPNGFSTPITEQIATFDAGLTLEDWLGLKPRYADRKTLSHPFHHAAALLSLLRACLLALREIHERGIVHLDIKADNICLPYQPYPFKPQPGALVQLDFDRLKLIDFAFSISRDNPLKHRLPVLPERAYQSGLFKTALREDAQRHVGPFHVDKLDWRADLYSLGHMIEGILDIDGLQSPKGLGGLAALQGIQAIVEQLKAFDQSERPSTLPHDYLLSEVGHLLEGLGDCGAHHRFALEPQDRPTAAGSTPLAHTRPSRSLPRRRFSAKHKAAAGLLLTTTLVVAGMALPKHTPPLVCPEMLTETAALRFQETAELWWSDVSRHQKQAEAVWQNLQQNLTQALLNPPSPGGVKNKASALACLQAMASLGDTKAQSARQAFKMRYLDFTSQASLYEWMDKPPAKRGRPSSELVQGFENLQALATAGDGDARKDLDFFKEKGVKLP